MSALRGQGAGLHGLPPAFIRLCPHFMGSACVKEGNLRLLQLWNSNVGTLKIIHERRPYTLRPSLLTECLFVLIAIYIFHLCAGVYYFTDRTSSSSISTPALETYIYKHFSCHWPSCIPGPGRSVVGWFGAQAVLRNQRLWAEDLHL